LKLCFSDLLIAYCCINYEREKATDAEGSLYSIMIIFLPLILPFLNFCFLGFRKCVYFKKITLFASQMPDFPIVLEKKVEFEKRNKACFRQGYFIFCLFV
jgi:hypothetical protein